MLKRRNEEIEKPFQVINRERETESIAELIIEEKKFSRQRIRMQVQKAPWFVITDGCKKYY